MRKWSGLISFKMATKLDSYLLHGDSSTSFLRDNSHSLSKNLLVLRSNIEGAADGECSSDLTGQMLHETCDTVFETSNILLCASNWHSSRLSAGSSAELNRDIVSLYDSLNSRRINVRIGSNNATFWQVKGKNNRQKGSNLSSSTFHSSGLTSNWNLIWLFGGARSVRVGEMNMTACLFHHLLDGWTTFTNNVWMFSVWYVHFEGNTGRPRVQLVQNHFFRAFHILFQSAHFYVRVLLWFGANFQFWRPGDHGTSFFHNMLEENFPIFEDISPARSLGGWILNVSFGNMQHIDLQLQPGQVPFWYCKKSSLSILI